MVVCLITKFVIVDSANDYSNPCNESNNNK